MSIKKLTYRDIPAGDRARAASEANRKLQGVLSDVTTSIEQREQARKHQAVIRQWTVGTLPTETTEAPSAPEPVPESPDAAVGPRSSHTVVVDESLQVRED
jgi:hypothetical protein